MNQRHVGIALVLALALAVTSSGCSYDDAVRVFNSGAPGLDTEEAATFDPKLPQGAESFEASKAAWTGDEQGFWHAHLEGRERTLYDTIYPHLVARDTEFELGNLEDLFEEGHEVSYYYDEEDNARDRASLDDFWDDYGVAVQAITYDHPEMFWLEGAGIDLYGESDWTYDDSGDAVGMHVFGITYTMSSDDIAQTQAAVDTALDEALSTIDKDAPDYEQAWQAFSWLVLHTTYTEEVADAISAGDHERTDELSEKYQGAQTALVDGVSVCAGYSHAYQLLLVRLGIPCTYVVGVGDPLDSQARHAWNLICVGGRYGYVDATWGDMEGTLTVSADSYDRNYTDYDNTVTREVDTSFTDYRQFFMSEVTMKRDGRRTDEDFHSSFDTYVPQNPHPYAALLPRCDTKIWVR